MRELLTLLLLLLVVLVVVGVSGDTRCAESLDAEFGQTWSYASTIVPPSQWSENYPHCGGSTQSPITLDYTTALTTADLHPLSWSHTQDSSPATAYNSGPALKCDLATPLNHILTDGYGDHYALVGTHIHWHQSNNSLGSEHRLRSYEHTAAEMHFVHYNSDKYSSLTSAVASGQQAAVAVVGVLFKVVSDATPNPVLQAWIDAVADGGPTDPDPHGEHKVNLSTTIKPEAFISGNLDHASYWHYSGSLTTPECNEVVRWYVMEQVVGIPESQVTGLRQFIHTTSTSDLMDTNARPVQPLNGRAVWLVHPTSFSSSLTTTHSSFLLLAAAMFLTLLLIF